MPYNHTATGSPNERELTPEEYRQLNREIEEKRMTNPKRYDYSIEDGTYREVSDGTMVRWEDFAHLDADAAGLQAELASVKACWAEALGNVAARNQDIDRLQDVIATREEALRALTRELPPLPAHEPLQQQSGVDFDKDLARLDGIRSTMADMRRYSLQGVPQGEVEFLLSFIDNLWREYSRLSNSDSGAPRREAGAGPWNPTTSSDVSIHTQTSQKSECAHVWLDVQKDSMRAYQQCSECGDTREPR